MKKSILYKFDNFNLCCGTIQNTEFTVIYRNLSNPQSVDGNMTQWIYARTNNQNVWGHVLIKEQQAIEFYGGDLVKIPNLNNKKAIWGGNGEWVSFNPIPYTDQYHAYKLKLESNNISTLQAEHFTRYAIILEGQIEASNQNGIKKKLSDFQSIKVLPGSTINFYSLKGAVLGIFWKNDYF